MNATLHLAPVLPWPWLAGLAAACAAAAGLALLRRARGAWLRLVVFGVVLAALANPRLVVQDRQPLPDVALLVVDDSPSQQVGTRPAETEAALAALRERLAHLPDLEVRVARTGGGEQGTRLFDAVDRALSDVPRRRLAGVVAITDGRVHDVPADGAAALGAPFHTILTGRPDERDRRLTVVRRPGFALVGQSAPLVLRIDDPGIGGTAALEVQVDGIPVFGRTVPLNGDVVVDIPIRHAGANIVELTAEAVPGELSAANNRQVLALPGVRDRLKVLLVSGQPHAGERAWRNLLKSDPSVDLVHFTILRPPEKDDRTPIRELSLITFPVRELFEDKLGDFDLVVFDRYGHRGILTGAYYQALADYVRKGGALLAAVGSEFAGAGGLADTALGEILPGLPGGAAVETPFRPRPTGLGRAHPVTAPLTAGGGDRTWGRWVRQMTVGRSGGQTLLAGADDRPLLLVDRVGAGRVALLLSDSLWLWARGYEGGGPHDELLRRLSHWLMREPDLEEESLTAAVQGGRLEIVRRSLASEVSAIAVTRPDGSAVSGLRPAAAGGGRWVVELPADQPGLWRAADATLQAVAVAGGENPLEMAELVATPDRLRPVAQATGGSITFRSRDGIPDIRRIAPGPVGAGRGWIGLHARGEYAVTGVRDVPLLPGFMLFILFTGGILAAWWREGR
jgi:hypothetical protein